ncbi:MAG: hypothetical protein FJ104_03660, partial [Deltaproteobacteria bacterium]|nr:hypothetical protein [Deltaproteobacteria bacterium]
GGTAAGGTGPEPEGHCGPGEYFEEGFLEAELGTYCIGPEREQAIANGIGPGAGYVDIESFALRAPMQVGQSTGFSRELTRFPPRGAADAMLEFWAATDACGATGVVEKFYEAPVASDGVYCGAVVPTKPYAYVLQVSRPLPVPAVGFQLHGGMVCATGQCSAP